MRERRWRRAPSFRQALRLGRKTSSARHAEGLWTVREIQSSMFLSISTPVRRLLPSCLGRLLPVAVLAVGAALAAAPCARAGDAGGITRAMVAKGLAAHRAVIDLKLVKATTTSNMSNLVGRMVFEVNGSSCDGYTVNFRFVTKVRDSNGKGRITDLRTSTFESGDSNQFDFLTQTYVDGKRTESTEGSARRKDGEVTVSLKEPQQSQFVLPGEVVFPNAHLVEMVYRALVGDRFAAVTLYDGSEGGEKVFPTSLGIGKEQTGPDDFSAEPAADIPLLHGVRRWPVSVAYYNGETGQGGEQTPVYEMRFLLYENGVSRSLVIDYGSFVLEGKVTELEPLEKPSCD